MNVEGRPRHRKSSRTLIITFLIGIGIGFSLCFAFLGVSLTGGLGKPGESANGEAPAGETRGRQLPDRQGLWPGRHLLVGVSGPTLEESERQMLHKVMPGGVVLRDRNLVDMAQAAELVDEIKTAVGLGGSLHDLPLIVLAQEKGPAFALLGMENAPTTAALGQMNDPSVAQKLGHLYGQALRNIGVCAVLGPVLDIYKPGLTDPSREAELFGSDKNTVAWNGVTFAEGLRDAGIIPIIKTYPGMGSAATREGGQTVIEAADVRDLVDMIQPFKRAVELNLPGILVGHAAVPVIDVEQPDLPASLSPKMVQKLLRDEFDYTGVVVAADISQGPLYNNLSPGEVVVRALAAGCDAVILDDIDLARLEAVCGALYEAVDEEALTMPLLEQDKVRLDQWRAFLQQPPTPAEPAPAPTIKEAAIDALGKTAAETFQPDATEHEVQPGETLSAIAKQYGVSIEDLETWNDLKGKPLQAGQTLTVRIERTPDPVNIAAGAPEDGTTEPEDAAAGSDSGEEPVPASEAAAETVQHTVAKGETLYFVATAYAVSTDEILKWNQLENSDLAEGQVLTIHPGAAAAAPETAPSVETYTVVAGDGLRKIAEKFHTTPQEILKLNDLKDPNKISVGQRLKVPRQ